VATQRDITTGEQAVAAAGAVTGSLDTSALAATALKTVKLTVRGLAAGKRALFAIEDTASATPFNDAIQVAVAHFQGTQPTEGTAKEWQTYDIPLTRFGVANSALRLNCLAIDATPGTVKAHAWIE
jgi:hypothetical protein